MDFFFKNWTMCLNNVGCWQVESNHRHWCCNLSFKPQTVTLKLHTQKEVTVSGFQLHLASMSMQVTQVTIVLLQTKEQLLSSRFSMQLKQKFSSCSELKDLCNSEVDVFCVFLLFLLFTIFVIYSYFISISFH